MAVPEPPASLNGHGHAAAERYASELSRGEVPGIRRIRRDMKVGQPRAQQVREYLTTLAGSNGYGRRWLIMARRRSSYYRPMSGRRLRQYLWRRLAPWPIRWLFGWK